jgi:hypothetical protein
MDKTLRCTVCTWRGAWGDAAYAQPIAPCTLPALLSDIQAAYEQKQAASVHFGMTREPPCPRCGHHTITVRRTPSFHPAM